MAKKRKVVIFGGSGFLGKHLVAQLLKENFEVWIYDLVAPKEKFDNKIRLVVGNILEKEKINKILHKAEIVFNLAGITDLEECLEKPFEAIKTNILGNTLILEACRKNKVKRFLYASSLYAQGNSGGIYSSTKKSCESIIQDYKKYYGLNYTILQYGTVYGYGAPNTNSIYRYLKQAYVKKRIKYPGDGTETREYIHVIDAAKLTIKSLDKEYENKTIIITGHHPIKVKDLFYMINDILGGIKIQYNTKVSKGKKDSHYRITPYSYQEEIPQKVTNNISMEMGRGMVEVLKEIGKEKNKDFDKEKNKLPKVRKHCFSDEETNVGIDFDGVIHNHNKGFHDGTIYGNPIEGVHQAMKLLSKKYNIVIYTAKAKPDRPLVNGETGTELVWRWLKEQKLDQYVKEVTSEKPRAVFYIDDLTIKFDSWEDALKQIKELENKKK